MLLKEHGKILDMRHSSGELWTYAAKSETGQEPEVSVAEYLERRGLGTWVIPTEEASGTVAIYTSEQGKLILEKIVGTPEFAALSNALSGRLGQPNVELCHWDEAIKKRVKALYWQNRRRLTQHLLNDPIKTTQVSGTLPWVTDTIDSNKKYIQQLHTIISESEREEQVLLGTHLPLSISEVNHLLRNIANDVFTVP